MPAALAQTQFIGIAGASASGKSTLAHALCAALPDQCLLLELDGYYRDLAHLDDAARNAVNFDHPEALDLPLFEAHLAALRSGRGIATPGYDFSRHTRDGTAIWQRPKPIVLVVGFLVLSVPAIQRRLDWGIYIEAPPAVRLARRIRRDAAERGRSESEVRARFHRDAEPAFAQYGQTAQMAAAMLLDGEAPVARNCDLVLSRLGWPTRERVP